MYSHTNTYIPNCVYAASLHIRTQIDYASRCSTTCRSVVKSTPLQQHHEAAAIITPSGVQGGTMCRFNVTITHRPNEASRAIESGGEPEPKLQRCTATTATCGARYYYQYHSRYCRGDACSPCCRRLVRPHITFFSWHPGFSEGY